MSKSNTSLEFIFPKRASILGGGGGGRRTTDLPNFEGTFKWTFEETFFCLWTNEDMCFDGGTSETTEEARENLPPWPPMDDDWKEAIELIFLLVFPFMLGEILFEDMWTNEWMPCLPAVLPAFRRLPVLLLLVLDLPALVGAEWPSEQQNR